MDSLTQTLQIMSSNLFMSIVSRLAEPEARKIIFSGSEKAKTGVSQLSRVSSVVNVNAAQALLAEEFSIMFREFHEFVIVSSKMLRYLDFDTIVNFRNKKSDDDYLKNALPGICSTVMTKIIENAPYEKDKGTNEESKEETLDSGATLIKTDGLREKKEFPAEKPWKKKKAPEKPKKVYDLTKWTQE